MLKLRPPIVAYLWQLKRRHRRLWSDASYTPGIPPRISWTLQELKSSSRIVGGTGIVCEDLLQFLIPRKSQICACESLVVPQLLIQKPEFLARADVSWFIHNEAACSSLIRGGSRHDDIVVLAALTHLAMLRSGARIWFEWIDSNSNPSAEIGP